MLALADGEEVFTAKDDQHADRGHEDEAEPTPLQHLLECLDEGRPYFRRALVQQILVFDAIPSETQAENVTLIPTPASSTVTTIKTVMCDITALLLAGMQDLISELQGLPSIESPSLISAVKQSNGAPDVANRIHQRISMPISASPKLGLSRTPNIIQQAPGSVPLRENSQSKSRPPALALSSEHASRDVSRDRFSVVEPGVEVPPSPRLAVSKGRFLVVLGSMLMQAGRWPDAMKSLSDGVAAARANSDNLWHARGLEYLLICMLLFVWAEKPFEFPSVCSPFADRRSKTEPSFYAPGSSKPDQNTSNQAVSEAPAASSQYLVSLFTDVIRTIMTLYTRASAFSADKMPQVLLCEVRLRLAGFLCVVHLRKGTLDKQGLDYMFRGNSLGDDPGVQVSSNSSFRKEELADMLLKAIPEPPPHVPLGESFDILLGIATLLSQLGLGRKQAFILKDVLSSMAPGLIEARKIGAAEMGIHPSAGLPLLPASLATGSSHLRNSTSVLLSAVAEMYGVPYGEHRPVEDTGNTDVEAIGARMRKWKNSRTFGDTNLKVEILRTCLNICEALPDLGGVITFVVQLLRTARNVVTLPPTYMSGAPSLSQEEQVRLYNTIKRTVAAAGKLGQSGLFANYWDEFLIRGIETLEPPESSRLTIHSPSELAAAVVTPSVATKKDPFIYSSFAKTASKSEAQTVVTTNEMAYFAVILQNPFEFDVEIDRISLVSDGCEFVASDHSIVLGQYCSQRFIMSGRPMKPGTLKITGCRARVRYCHEQNFLIFTKPWMPSSPVKLKRRRPGKAPPWSAGPTQNGKPTLENEKDPEAEVLSLTVLDAQPSLSVITSTLSQPALMLLEGETKSFQITIHNASSTASADLLLFTYQDSATSQLQDALAGRELSPAELYGLQLQLAGKPSLRWVPESDDGSDPSISAGEISTFTFEIFGKPALLSGVIQVDYAHVGVPPSEIKERFYTRQLRHPISLTVNGAIDLPRCNILPFTGDFAWKNQLRADQGLRSRSGTVDKVEPARNDDQLMPLLSRLGLGSHGSDHCLLLLDLRNVWPNPLSISIQVRESTAKTSSPTDPWRRAYTVHELLQPGHISRVVLLVPRIFIPEPHAPIPLIGNQRQFVVSASKLSAENEAASRENFWHREELLRYIRGSWREDSTGREGVIDMRKGIWLNSRMIDVMKIDEIEISFSIHPFNAASESEEELTDTIFVKQSGRSRFVLKPRTFATLTVKIHNHSAEPMHLLLRLQPSLRNQPHTIALDLSKRFAWTGMLQRSLHPPVQPGEIREADLGITAFCEGDFEIGATVEELRVPKRTAAAQSDGAPLMPAKRRIWHAREPCLIDAVGKQES